METKQEVARPKIICPECKQPTTVSAVYSYIAFETYNITGLHRDMEGKPVYITYDDNEVDKDSDSWEFEFALCDTRHEIVTHSMDELIKLIVRGVWHD